MEMDIEKIINENMDDEGNINVAKIKEEIENNTVSKAKYDEQVEQTKGAYAKAKSKYKKPEKNNLNSDDKNDSVDNVDKNDVDVEKIVENRLNAALTDFEKQQQLKEELNKVKPEFRDYVGHLANTKDDFKLEEFLKENDQYAEKVSTQSPTIKSTLNAEYSSDQEKAIANIIDMA